MIYGLYNTDTYKRKIESTNDKKKSEDNIQYFANYVYLFLQTTGNRRK